MDTEKLLSLLKDMSLEEKIGQLCQICPNSNQKTVVVTGPTGKIELNEKELILVGSMLNVSGATNIKTVQKENLEKHPHKIPLMFMLDVINGFETIFPIPLAQGCSFEPELSEKAAQIAAKEAAASGLHVTFSPMADLVRDSRWGRVMESTGEDPYLNSLFTKAFIRGYQGCNISEKGRIAACFKHFAAYGAPEGGREYENVELSERTLREDYLPSYKAAVEAECSMAMASFNTFDRIPVTANKKLLRSILREEMGFKGVLISDYSAIEELVIHGVAENPTEAAMLAISAGVDIDMMSASYIRGLKSLVISGTVDISLIDEAVFRVLSLKNKLGLFENPYKDADENDEKNLILCEKHRETAYELAVKSFVLLKNDEILPLNKEQDIAFIGPYSDNKEIFGSWSFPKNNHTVTIKEGVENLKTAKAVFLHGCKLLNSGTILKNNNIFNCDKDIDEKDISKAVDTAISVQTVVLCLGEHREQSGEAASKTDLSLPSVQLELFNKIYKVNKNIVVVIFAGRPLELEEIAKKAKAILYVWMPGTEGGRAVADVLYGIKSPEGRLTMSFPLKASQLPIYYNCFNTGRPNIPETTSTYKTGYIDCPSDVLFPFGYGLSYSVFKYSEVRLNTNTLTRNNKIEASMKIQNIGNKTCVETIQMYICDIVGSVVRPMRMLKGFKKVKLREGESTDVYFNIDETMLRFYDADMNYRSENGKFKVYIGANSNTKNATEFYLIDN